MKHGSIALLVIAGCFYGCLYGDPDYGSTQFACDLPDHPCPDDAPCVSGVCNGSVGGPGVFCDEAGTCTTGQKCCTNPTGAPMCIANASACPTGPAAECDSSDDCGADTCCEDTNGPVCLPGSCSQEACVDQGDCPGNAPNCCRFDPTVSWGYCLPIACT